MHQQHQQQRQMLPWEALPSLTGPFISPHRDTRRLTVMPHTPQQDSNPLLFPRTIIASPIHNNNTQQQVQEYEKDDNHRFDADAIATSNGSSASGNSREDHHNNRQFGLEDQIFHPRTPQSDSNPLLFPQGLTFYPVVTVAASSASASAAPPPPPPFRVKKEELHDKEGSNLTTTTTCSHQQQPNHIIEVSYLPSPTPVITEIKPSQSSMDDIDLSQHREANATNLELHAPIDLSNLHPEVILHNSNHKNNTNPNHHNSNINNNNKTISKTVKNHHHHHHLGSSTQRRTKQSMAVYCPPPLSSMSTTTPTTTATANIKDQYDPSVRPSQQQQTQKQQPLQLGIGSSCSSGNNKITKGQHPSKMGQQSPYSATRRPLTPQRRRTLMSNVSSLSRSTISSSSLASASSKPFFETNKNATATDSSVSNIQLPTPSTFSGTTTNNGNGEEIYDTHNNETTSHNNNNNHEDENHDDSTATTPGGMPSVTYSDASLYSFKSHSSRFTVTGTDPKDHFTLLLSHNDSYIEPSVFTMEEAEEEERGDEKEQESEYVEEEYDEYEYEEEEMTVEDEETMEEFYEETRIGEEAEEESYSTDECNEMSVVEEGDEEEGESMEEVDVQKYPHDDSSVDDATALDDQSEKYEPLNDFLQYDDEDEHAEAIEKEDLDTSEHARETSHCKINSGSQSSSIKVIPGCDVPGASSLQALPSLVSHSSASGTATTTTSKTNFSSSSAPSSSSFTTSSETWTANSSTASSEELLRIRMAPMKICYVSRRGEECEYTGFYSGPINARGEMHGNGVFWFNTGDLYLGQFESGNLHGVGMLSILVEEDEAMNKDDDDGNWKWKKEILKGYFYWNEYVGTEPIGQLKDDATKTTSTTSSHRRNRSIVRKTQSIIRNSTGGASSSSSTNHDRRVRFAKDKVHE